MSRLRKLCIIPLVDVCVLFCKKPLRHNYRRLFNRSRKTRIARLFFRKFMALCGKKPPKTEYKVSIVATARNETPYFAEWIEYHLLMGIEHFYLYNNNSDDNMHEVLKPYIEKGYVTYTPYPGKNKQIEIYTHAIDSFEYCTEYMFFLDIDEFLFLKNHQNIQDLLKEYKEYNRLRFKWAIFGSSSHKKTPQGLVIENFLYRAISPHEMVKSLVKPYFIGDFEVHWGAGFGKECVIPFEEARINHYYCKSEEEFLTRKAARGYGYTDTASLGYSIRDFQAHDQNEIYDDSILKHTDTIKQNICQRYKI